MAEEPEDRLQPARLVFRCRRCGEKEDGPEGGLRTVETVLIQLLSSGSKGVNVTGAGQVTPCSMHVCEDGGRGVTDIEGIELCGNRQGEEKKPTALKSAPDQVEEGSGEQ